MTNRYQSRLVDANIADLLDGVPAIFIEGAKGVGKTMTAEQFAKTVFRLDETSVREAVANNMEMVRNSEKPVLIDEWQYVPDIWNRLRRWIDGGTANGSFILTGSVSKTHANLHSGAGRIIPKRMRPLSLQERIGGGGVGIARLLAQERPFSASLSGKTSVAYSLYLSEIVRSGFPGIRRAKEAFAPSLIEGYIRYALSHDFMEQGVSVRRPQLLLRWLTAYAAAMATDTGYSEILDAASAGESDKPARNTTLAYREALQNLWLLDELPPWLGGTDYFSRLKQTPKHYLADPALACSLLKISRDDLERGRATTAFDARHGNIAGRLFETLICQSVRVYADAAGACVSYLRTQNGDHEVDFIIQRGRRIIALEVKSAPTVSDADVRHLLWLKGRMGDALLDAAVITTGSACYRRKADGVGVIPAALLGA